MSTSSAMGMKTMFDWARDEGLRDDIARTRRIENSGISRYAQRNLIDAPGGALRARDGAVIPGHDTTGRDDVDAKLTRGEAVLPVRTVDAMGGPGVVSRLIKATNGKDPAVRPKAMRISRGRPGYADGVVPKEEEEAVIAPGRGNYREVARAHAPVGDTIRAGVVQTFPNTVAQVKDMQGKFNQAYDRGGLISAAAEATKRSLQPAIGIAQDVATSAGRVGQLLNPFSKPASAQPPKADKAAAPKPKTSTVSPQGERATPVAVGGGDNALMPAGVVAKDVGVMNKMGAPAAPAPARPTISGAATKPPVRAAAPAKAPTAAQAPTPVAQADDSVIIDRGIGPSGSTMAMIDHNTGSVLTSRGGTDVYRPFEGEYMTQGQQDAITAGRLNIGDQMTVGQAGTIGKHTASMAERSMAEAGATARTDKTVAGGIAQQRISTGGAIQSANIAHGEANKIKVLENQAIVALSAAISSGDPLAIAQAQQQLAAIRGGTGTEFAPLNIYDDMGNVVGQRLYNKKNGVVQGMGGERGITQADISATAKKHGISEEEVVQRLKAEGKL